MLSGLATRLRVVGARIEDVAVADALGARAPDLAEPEMESIVVQSGWSTARAAARREGAKIRGPVVVATAEHARRLSGVTVIEGDLWVYNVADLAPLAGLTEVTGRLTIQRSQLSSFGSLRRVGGDLNVRDTDAPTLDALARLESVGGNLLIAANPNLHGTGAPRALRRVGGSIELPVEEDGNPRLTDISFPALETADGVCIADAPASMDTDPNCWWSDGCPQATYVKAVRIRPFPRLVSAGRCAREELDLVLRRPELFPGLM